MFSSNDAGRWQISIMDRDGSHMKRLTDLPDDNIAPAISAIGFELGLDALVALERAVEHSSVVTGVETEGPPARLAAIGRTVVKIEKIGNSST